MRLPDSPAAVTSINASKRNTHATAPRRTAASGKAFLTREQVRKPACPVQRHAASRVKRHPGDMRLRMPCFPDPAQRPKRFARHVPTVCYLLSITHFGKDDKQARQPAQDNQSTFEMPPGAHVPRRHFYGKNELGKPSDAAFLFLQAPECQQSKRGSRNLVGKNGFMLPR